MLQKRIIWGIGLLVLTLAVACGVSLASQQPTAIVSEPPAISGSATISVSGTITGPSGPVPDVWIGVGSPQDWQEDTTDANGFYSVSIETDGELRFHVRPQVSTRLHLVNFRMDGITTSFTRDIVLTYGNLIRLQLIGSDGSPLFGGVWLEAQPMIRRPDPQREWYGVEWSDEGQYYQSVLPPDVYYVTVHYEVPAGYYPTTQVFDLRTADQSTIMVLDTTLVNPIPYDPPDAAKITIGPPDDLGQTIVTGTSGAVLPLAHVLLVNLNSSHQARAVSEADGSFTARIYAPPGSAIMVKHGPDGWGLGRWNDLEVGISEGVNPFPGTIINVPHTHVGGDYELPFAAAGAIDFFTDDPANTRNYVSSAWAITGTIGPVIVEGEWTRVLTGTYDSQGVPGLYLGGLNWTHPALGDLDDDGDLDLLVGERSGHLVLYRNQGSATSPDWQFEAADYADVATDDWAYPALADVTGDGVPDLFVGAGHGTVSIRYSDGTPDVTLTAGNGAAPALADLDNDGDLDLLVGHAGGTLYHFKNTGTPTNPVWTQQTSSYGNISEEGEGLQPAFVDLDGDTDLDLLVGLCGQLVWYERGGTPVNPTWTRHAADPIGYGGGSCGTSPGAGDWDGDGYTDLVIGEHWGVLRFFRHGISTLTPTLSLEGRGWGRVDAHLTEPSSWSEQAFPFPFDLAGDTAPALADWDGESDLVMAEYWGVLRFFRHGISTLTPTLSLEGRGSFLPSLPGRGWGRVDAHLTEPSSWSEQAFLFPFDLAGDTAPALADWDDDGDLDLLLGQVWGNVHQYTNVGDNTNPDWRPDGVLLTLPWTNHPHAFPTFADVDGDNDYDLFIGEGGWQGVGAGGNIHYYRNDGAADTPNWTQVTDRFLALDVGGWSTPVFVDIDADSDLDLFIGDEGGTLTFVENTGTPTAPDWAAPVQPYADLHLGEYSAPAFFDVDQDGDLDMLVGLESGSLAYVRNTGAADSPSWELVTTAYPGIDVGHHATPTVADGALLIGDGDGGLNVYLYDGPGTPPAIGTAYAPGDTFQVEGTIRLYSPAITTTTDVEAISVQGGLSLAMLFDQDGQPLAAENYFMSTLLTPSGFPIQRPGRPGVGLESRFDVTNLHYDGGHVIEGDLNASGRLPEGVLPGIYRPAFWLDFSGVPTSTNWLAANVTQYTFNAHEALLPPITVGTVDPPRLIWRLLMDDFVQGTRGAGAREDRGTFELASQIVSQGAPYYTPPVDVRSGQPIIYRLEPFLPMISFTDRRMPAPPLLPFELPGGQLSVQIQQPDGTVRVLGSEAFAQSFNRTRTTRAGNDLNSGTVQLEDVYSLKAASDRFRVTFDQYGHHVITMTGTVSDIWGNTYAGGGTYDLWIAHPLDIDPGVLPGTPLAVGDAFNPTMQFYPRVPADVTLTLTLYPDSDPAQAITHTISGHANDYGYFSLPNAQYPISLTHPGEYRVDLTAIYTDPDGTLYMGAMTWGGVVMTPENEAYLIAHGRRGLDSLPYIPNHWFVNSRDLNIPNGAISHSFNPYFNGDIYWSRMSDGPYGGDSLLLGASVQDTVGVIEAAVRARAERQELPLSSPGSLSERFDAGEIPLFTSTRSGRPVQMMPEDADQIAYSYRYSQRPGVRVREVVAEDGQTGGYWRLDTLYDDQLGVGVLGDQPNDFKFQYVGAVYRDLDSGHNEYLGQGTGWIFIPDDDPTGSRVMPPFAGPGNGGWTTEGGPILTLKGEDIHIFILPTGVRPGAVLEVGDTFHFAGHIMPTLDSQVAVTVTAPSGAQHLVGGQANRVGYFYDPDDDFVVDEPGLWSVDVRVWHDGQIGSGQEVYCDPNNPFDPSLPCPSGDVMGSEGGRYWFYVVPGDAPRLDVSSPSPGFLSFGEEVTPITIAGEVPAGLSGATVDYTISMPGYILEHGQVTPSGGTYQITFDPVTLYNDFPNLDLVGRDDGSPGLADTFAIGLLLRGQSGGSVDYRANTITVQGEQVFVREALPDLSNRVYLPLILKGG